MQIGMVIRKYRKAKNLTQEELARRLNVSPPAVNKWERGVTSPDVALLAPLARLLGISCDELLNFREELSQAEIKSLTQEAQQRLEQADFATVVDWARQRLAEYPNCEQLRLNLSQLLEAWRVVQQTDDPSWDKFLGNNLEILLASPDETIRSKAAENLFHLCLRREKYEQAEHYLSYFSQQNPDVQYKQALLYQQSGRLAEAWQAYEQLLFQTGNQMSILLHQLYQLAWQENEAPKAQLLAEKQAQLARLLEMGAYHELVDRLDFACKQQDAAATVQLMKQLLHCDGEELAAFVSSPLFSHLQLKPPTAKLAENVAQKLRRHFQNLDNFPFIRQDAAALARWQKLF